MNLELGPELIAFRDEVRDFLEDYRDTHGFFHHEGDHHIATLKLHRALGERNWLALAWPTDAGGEGRHPLYEFVLWDEMARYRAARPPLGSGIVAKTIIAAGTQEQKERFLPRLRTAEIAFSLGYSEPEAGSDLAALRTRAVRDGDRYILNGQKRWTSGGHRADYLWVLCRTGEPEARGRALTILIVDMTSPGITVSPIPAVGGERFNEVFFDDVEVPLANRIGEENGGWRLISESLATERHVQFSPARVQQDFAELVSWLKERGLTDDPVVRHRLVDTAVVVAEVEAHALALLEAVQDGRDAAVEAAANKLAGSEAAQAVARVAGDLGAPESVMVGSEIEFLWRQSISETIGGGTSEIMRGVIASQGLGLPIR
ncbi:acyl-CoA dehydrogenase family protein [Candidatus Poriferisocius sp.]|uniref:acyl-CoA dehydrogenase family protein n=1 Tax=Candidatus Poriferisocius sp. TaxID=3101276 RepID=UPI003B5C3DE4